MVIVDSEFNRSMGLGNKLFPWARAYCATQILDAIQVEPRWFALRNAAFLRGGIDYRNLLGKVFLYNNFKSDPAAINRLYIEIQIRLRAIQYQKYYLSDLKDLKSQIFSDCYVIFRSDRAHHFSDLAEYRHAIKQKLQQLSQSRAHWQSPAEPFIAINYRSGNDFTAHTTDGPHAKTDLNWFIRAIYWVRQHFGSLPVYVVSDGGSQHLAYMLQGIEGCQIKQSETAIEDLLFLSKANILLASGNSSFSAWAAFLSGADSYSSKATPLDKWHINVNNPNQIIGTID
jgi:Glycosyl transferase family 11